MFYFNLARGTKILITYGNGVEETLADNPNS